MTPKRKGLLFGAILIILLIVWLVLSAVLDIGFWSISFKDWIALVFSLIIGIVFAYILTEKNNKKRTFVNAFIEQISSLKEELTKCDEWVLTSYLKKDFLPQLLSYNKLINNSIDVLSKYAKEMKIEEELSFIRERFIEYKTVTTECTAELKKEEQRIKSSLKIGLIIGKLDEIILKLNCR